MSALQKPKMRGLQMAYLRQSVIVATAGVVTFGILFKVFFMDARKKRYEEFYKTYDDDKQLKIMQEAGLMQSYNPK